jgi:predicted DsbA family dithiol-disulfide isomerase
MNWERSLELNAQLKSVGDFEKIHCDFDKAERTPNTVDAHRLIWFADQHECQDPQIFSDAFRQVTA